MSFVISDKATLRACKAIALYCSTIEEKRTISSVAGEAVRLLVETRYPHLKEIIDNPPVETKPESKE